MKKIVYLPLDERPCNANFAGFALKNNPDYALISPPADVLGDKKTPADFEKVKAFLKTECRNAYALALSVDTLLYGGIVPSRLHQFTEETLLERLAVITELKKDNPSLKLYAFSLIMRCPSYSSDDEEPDYYGTCGREIFLRGQAVHKYAEGLIGEEEYRKTIEKLDAVIGENLSDFLKRRKTNLSLLCSTLAMGGKEIDKFVIPQDDSAPYGYTAIDQKTIKDYIAKNGLKQVDIYPGADEVGMTLISAILNADHAPAPRICPVFPKEECRKVIPLFEDREVERSIASQIKSAGAILCENEEEADILLFCNLPVGEMHNISNVGGETYDKRDLEAFTRKMKEWKSRGKRIAAADIAYSNGGDVAWLKLIEKELGIFNLCGYAGWNTSSNTLGTVIYQAVLHYYYGDTESHFAFTAERVYEDIGYCAYVRAYMCNKVLPNMDGLSYDVADGKRGEVARIVKASLEEYIEKEFPTVYARYRIDECYMPWSRMFEVGLTVRSV